MMIIYNHHDYDNDNDGGGVGGSGSGDNDDEDYNKYEDNIHLIDIINNIKYYSEYIVDSSINSMESY